MTAEQKQRVRKLEKMYGSKADVVAEVVIVAFSPDSQAGVTFGIDQKGNICKAEELAARAMSLR